MTSVSDNDLAGVLDFWFGELQRADWFRVDTDLDRRISARLSDLHEAVLTRIPDSAYRSADAALATILLFDQYPRNAFRGTPRAFATDGLAIQLAEATVQSGLDSAMPADRRVFAYLPFEHSEALADQDLSVALISELGDDEFTRYAHAHHDVIAKFGRFPHRNAILGRQSTPDEAACLAQPGSGF